VEPLFVALMRRRTAARRLDSNFVFHVEGQPVKYSGLNRRWEAATRGSGVPGKWMHDFRRAAYQRFLANGMDPQTARLLIGHASSQTMDRYNVVTLPRLVDGLERVVALENLRRTGAGVGREGGGSPS
jgi:integrase